MHKETSRNKWGELANRSWELRNETKLLHLMTLFKIKEAKHCNLSASLSYPDILRQTIENYTYKVS